MLSGHAAFVATAYIAAALILGGLIAWVIADHRAQQRLLADLETRGIRRRSAQKDGA